MIFATIFILATLIFSGILQGGAYLQLEMNGKLTRDFLIYSCVVLAGYGLESYY